MKLIKLLLKAVVTFVVLIVIGIIGLVMVIDPNDYKPEITQLVKDETGRDLTIQGDIGWSFFPRLGFSLGKTQLSNAKGFKAPLFAKVEAIDVGLQIKPLFQGKVELDVMVLKGMTANLEVNKDGSSNWDDLVASTVSEESEPVEDNPNELELPPIRFQGIVIENAQVRYTDRVGATDVLLEDFNFSTGVVKLWEPIKFKGDFRVENKYPQLNAKTSYSGTLIAKVLEDKFGLQNFILGLNAKGDLIPNGAIALTLRADVDANTKTEVADLKKLQIKFDDTTIDGKASMHGFTKPAIKFDVAIDQLNADRYIPKNTSEAAPAPEGETAPVSGTEEDPVIVLPTKMLRDLNLEGQLRVGQFQFMDLQTQDVKAGLKARKGLINFKPLGIKLYEGVFDGSAVVDVRKDVPNYKVDAKLNGLQVHPLLKTFADFDKVSGKGAFNIDIHTKGQRVSELKRGLNGKLDASFADGVIKANILGSLSELLQAFGKTTDAANIAGGQTTPFKTLKMRGTVVNGKYTSNSLNVDAGKANITGGGSFDIPTEYVDFGLRIEQSGKGCEIPLKGKVTEIDYAKFAKRAIPNCVKSAAKAALKAEKEKLKAEAKARVEAEKAKLKAEAQAKVDAEKARLKAKAEAEKQRAKEKVKNKLNDALKGLF